MTLTGAHRDPGRGEEGSLDYAPAVYGALLVTTLVTVQWRSDANPELIGISLLIAVGAFWLTDVWSEIVAHRVNRPIDRTTAFALGRAQAPMLTSAIVPAIVLATPRFFGVSVDAAIGAALVASLVQLFLWGLAVGRAAHAGAGLAFLVALVDCGIGIGVVVLKVLVLH